MNKDVPIVIFLYPRKVKKKTFKIFKKKLASEMKNVRHSLETMKKKVIQIKNSVIG